METITVYCCRLGECTHHAHCDQRAYVWGEKPDPARNPDPDLIAICANDVAGCMFRVRALLVPDGQGKNA